MIMLKFILFISILINVNAEQKEIRDLKHLRLEAIASKRYHKEAMEKLAAAEEKEEAKIQFIKDSEKAYKDLQIKYKCGGASCSHSRISICYRARASLKKAEGVIEKSEKALIKLTKDATDKKKLVKKYKLQYEKYLKDFIALKNKYAKN